MLFYRLYCYLFWSDKIGRRRALTEGGAVTLLRDALNCINYTLPKRWGTQRVPHLAYKAVPCEQSSF